MSNLELLDRAAASATCQMLGAAGASLVGAGAVSLWAAGTGFVPITAGGLSLLAANYLCPDMPMGGAEPPNSQIDGCGEMSPGGYGQFQWKDLEGVWASITGNAIYQNATRIGEIISFERTNGSWSSSVEVYAGDALVIYQDFGIYASKSEADSASYRILPVSGSCAYDPDQPLPPPPPDAFEPIEYTDDVTNCTYNVTLQGFAQTSEGAGINPVYMIESAPVLRNDGGRMGGCNFAPTIYMPTPGGPGGGGGGVNIPVPPSPPGPSEGIPWWAGPLAGAVGGALLNQLAEVVNDLLAPTLEEGQFTLTAPCNKDEAGNPLQREWTFPAQREPARLLSHQVALMEIMQQHLDWKTPICRDTPTLEGDFRTISFRSDETSPFGKSRLRKRFRYRSVSGNDLSAIVDHWKDFTWEGGPYRVRWVGPTWRTPEVWAASEAEGQRVIQHASREAGFDPLETGEWRTRVSSSSRLGVVSNFRVDTTGGYYWITARDGSDQRPIVARG